MGIGRIGGIKRTGFPRLVRVEEWEFVDIVVVGNVLEQVGVDTEFVAVKGGISEDPVSVLTLEADEAFGTLSLVVRIKDFI